MINRTQTGGSGYNLILGPTAVAHAVPTIDSCGFAGCLTRASTVLFTELVYTGSVNTSSGLPVNNYVLPQLTDYFPTGNPLRSCTTASLVSDTAEAHPALAKRQVQVPLVTDVFAGVPDLTATSSFTVQQAVLDSSALASGSANADGNGPTAPKSLTEPSDTATAATTPESSQQSAQTQAGSPTSPLPTSPQASGTQATGSGARSSDPGPSSTGAANTGASNVGNSATGTTGSTIQSSNSALGTMSQTVTGMVGNSSSTQASTWNYICSAEGCTLASNSESASGGPIVSSSSTADASQTTTTTQGGSGKINLSGVLGSAAILVALVFSMA